MKEIVDGNKTMFIKFPAVTKLSYPHQPVPQKHDIRQTVYRSNPKTQTNFRMNSINRAQSFKIIQLPQKNEIMNICTMTMREKPKEEQSQEKQKLDKIQRKKIFSVCKLNSLKLVNDQRRNSRPATPLKPRNSMSLKKLNKPTLLSLSSPNLTEAYTELTKLFALSFRSVVITSSWSKLRKAKIDNGNNGVLVKQVLKKRMWWNAVNQEYKSTDNENINLIWIQHKLNEKHLTQLIKYNECSMKEDSLRYEEMKPAFQRSFQRTFNQLPKMKQLFFTQWEEEPLRLKDWIFRLSQEPKRAIVADNVAISNHLPMNWQMTNKKLLYKNMVNYYLDQDLNPHENVPKTYHLTCFNWQEVVKQVRGSPCKWMYKPGEFTNRGKGITYFKNTKEAINHIIMNPPKDQLRTFLLQEYITPLLYEQRKFDIRCYMLGLQVGDCLKFFWYEEGYIRTASQKFTLKKSSKSIHLTNDAIQKNVKNYGEYESANKLSYQQMDKYFLNNTTYNFTGKIVPQMKMISRDICHAVGDSRLIGARAGISFEIFGLDFLIDQKGKPWLIEVNTNPCLDISCSLLSRIIPEMLQNTFRLVCDVFLPPKKTPDYSHHFLMNNKYSLIYSNSSKFQQ